ncbi:hypothetical protein NYF23_00455 [SAR92 clade bacterium H455]|uniref:Uncharacterized protein n=1 Tax=SAR92 clade bacterium H455 TaxID=2974818 RepID=A0ABY5TMK9_9GAMM|nr:hypothetical protein NYF23_00455 [SAR92 clade bacterium H455]
MKIFIIKSHDGSILGKDLEWTDGTNANLIFTAQHRDIALNQLIELNAKNIHLRAEIVACDADKKGRPTLVLDDTARLSEAPANTDQVSAA